MKPKSSVLFRGPYVIVAAVAVVAVLGALSLPSLTAHAHHQPAALSKPERPSPLQAAVKLAAETEEEGIESAEEAAEVPAEEEESDWLSNESCIDCHNKDILEMTQEDLADQVEVGEEGPQPPEEKPPFVFGELSLSIDLERYQESVHMDLACIDCHMDIEDLPHKQRLEQVDCAMCHDGAVEALETSAHAGAPPCIGCHDAHYSQGVGEYEEQWRQQLCVKCHKAYDLVDTESAHQHLYGYQLHLESLGCMKCHQGEESGVHYIAPVGEKVAQCEDCHSRYTILASEEAPSMPASAYWLQSRFINKSVLEEHGYVVGANRIPLLDLIVIIAVLAPLGLPIVHGGLRILTRRKEPVDLPEEKILLHPLVERIWHWVQALAIVVLIITGILIHWPEWFPGWFEWGVTVHNWFGWLAVIAWLVWLIYNLGTGRIKHYFPRRGEIPEGMIKQGRFYAYGIFKHEEHPYAPTEDNKFNPLQKIAYLKFQLFLFPLLLISGLLYMYPQTFSGVIDAIGGMTVLAMIHYILAALFAAFLLAHLYLATTGETVGENFKAIITGYGVKSEHHGKH